jgi:hypothetical protein
MRMSVTPHVPLSWGEVLDKITILEIKSERIEDAAKRANVVTELTALRAIAAPVLDEVSLLISQLRVINESLWEIEDNIRNKEAAASFDAEFIKLARAVYHTNDARAAVKRRINLELKSALVEEKNYMPYAAGQAKPPELSD